MGPQTKQREQLPEAGKGEEMYSPLSALREPAAIVELIPLICNDSMYLISPPHLPPLPPPTKSHKLLGRLNTFASQCLGHSLACGRSDRKSYSGIGGRKL